MAANPLLQRLAFEQFHRDIANAILLPDIMNSADIGVVERRDGARLLFEPITEAAQGSLDGHAPAEPRVARFVNLPHSSRAKCTEDFIRAELVTRGQGHRVWSILPHTKVEIPAGDTAHSL